MVLQTGMDMNFHYRHRWCGVGSDDVFEDAIRKQVELAMEEADVIIFMVDAKEGMSPLDEDVADMIRAQQERFSWLPTKWIQAWPFSRCYGILCIGF
jgi:hypothetical protein